MADIEEEDEARRRLIDNMLEQARVGEIGVDADIKRYLETTRMGKALKGTTEFVGKLGRGAADSAKAMGNSTGSFDDLTGAVNLTIGAVSGLLSAIPVVGSAFSKLGDVAQEAASFAIGQVQKNYTAFQDLAKAGQIGADGVVGMANQFEKAGMPLATYSKLLTKNSEDLAFFGGSARAGASKFTNVMESMKKGEGMRLRNLGFSLEEMGDTVIDFQKTYQRMGMLQSMTQEELTNASIEYGKELDMIAKVTGQQREAVQKNRETMLADTRFRAWQNQQTTDEGKKRAQAAGDLVMDLKRMAPTMAEGIKDLFASGGIPVTDAGKRLVQQGMGPTIERIRKSMMDGSMDMATARKEMFSAALENRDKFKDLSAILGDFGVGIPYEEMADMAKAVGMSEEEIKKNILGQKKQSKGADKTTTDLNTSMADLQISIAKVNKAFIATPLATNTIGLFSDALLGSIEVIEKAFAPNGPTGEDEYDAEIGDEVNIDDGKPKSMTMWSDLIAWAKGDDKLDKEKLVGAKDITHGIGQVQPLSNISVIEPSKSAQIQPTQNVVSAKPNRAQSRTRPKQLEAEIATRETALSNARVDAAKGGITQKEMAGLDKMADTLVSMQKQLVILNDKTDKANVGRDKQTKTIANR